MKLSNILISLIVNYATAISIPDHASIEERQSYIGQLCTAPIAGTNFVGTCELTTWCHGRKGTPVANHCPGPNDVECCIDPECASGVTGYCELESEGCGGGIFVSGHCPGPKNYLCCSLNY